MTDPIAATLTSIRNANVLQRSEVSVPYSKLKEQLLLVLKQAGYIEAVNKGENPSADLQISLIPGKIRNIDRLSKPGHRWYVGYHGIPTIKKGLGTVIISTPRGLMTGEEARSKKLGGELICEIS